MLRRRWLMVYCSLILGAVLGGIDPTAQAIFVDGHGHYGVRGESRKAPGYSDQSAFQAIDQSFRLETEVRSGDKASFLTEFRVFDRPRQAFLGDTPEPEDCAPLTSPDPSNPDVQYPANTGSTSECAGRHQDASNPHYRDFQPKIHKAYVRYAGDVCLLEVGRRGRQWGLGLLLDDGTDVFDTRASIYDGFTCDINIQKSQTMGFSVGYDKLVETGVAIDAELDEVTTYGPRNQEDDMEQFFVTIMFDDGRGSDKEFSKQIGIYFANIMSSGDRLKTDVKVADLFLGFFGQDWRMQNEVIFRLGKTADPTFTRLGGGLNFDGDGGIERNNVNAIALGGRLDYFLSRSGRLTSPEDFRQGTLESHSLFLEWAYAPGDEQGYLPLVDEANNLPRTDNKAKAVAFHANYKPALILFNGRTDQDDLRIDGVFDPYRVMNAKVFSLGYEYRSISWGVFTAKLITASMNQGISAQAKETYEKTLKDDATAIAPMGYRGTDLGTELDLSYTMMYDYGFELGAALGMAFPGSAWDTVPDSAPKNQYLLQGSAAFRF